MHSEALCRVQTTRLESNTNLNFANKARPIRYPSLPNEQRVAASDQTQKQLRYLVGSGFAILTLGSLALVGYSSYQHNKHVYAPYGQTTARVLQIHSCKCAADVSINFTVNGTSIESRMTTDDNNGPQLVALDQGVDIVYDKKRPQNTWSGAHDVSGPWDAGIVLGVLATLVFLGTGCELRYRLVDRQWPFRVAAAAAASQQAIPTTVSV